MDDGDFCKLCLGQARDDGTPDKASSADDEHTLNILSRHTYQYDKTF